MLYVGTCAVFCVLPIPIASPFDPPYARRPSLPLSVPSRPHFLATLFPREHDCGDGAATMAFAPPTAAVAAPSLLPAFIVTASTVAAEAAVTAGENPARIFSAALSERFVVVGWARWHCRAVPAARCRAAAGGRQRRSRRQRWRRRRLPGRRRWVRGGTCGTCGRHRQRRHRRW